MIAHREFAGTVEPERPGAQAPFRTEKRALAQWATSRGSMGCKQRLAAQAIDRRAGLAGDQGPRRRVPAAFHPAFTASDSSNASLDLRRAMKAKARSERALSAMTCFARAYSARACFGRACFARAPSSSLATGEADSRQALDRRRVGPVNNPRGDAARPMPCSGPSATVAALNLVGFGGHRVRDRGSGNVDLAECRSNRFVVACVVTNCSRESSLGQVKRPSR